MKIHLIFLTLLAFLNLGIETALAEGLGVEAGVKMSGFFPTQTAGEDEIFGGLGFSGQASYETEHWGFGVRTQGSVSTRTPFHIKAGEFNFNGSLRRRQYDIEFLARYFLLDAAKNKRWYVEFAFQAIEADFIDFEGIYTLPESPDYTRLFLKGNAFTIGGGYRPKSGPYFFQLNYQLSHYDEMVITGNVNSLHPALRHAQLNQGYFVHTITFLAGLDVFGR